MRRHVKSNRGFTLLELVLAMAIISIVVLMVFSSMSYGYTSFRVSANQNSTQAEVRIASDYVTRTMRFATYVLPSPDLSQINDTHAVDYLYLANGSLIHSAYNGDAPRIVRTLATGLQPESYFWSSYDEASMTQLLGLHLVGVENRQHFDLQTAIELPNLVLRRNIISPDVPDTQSLMFEKHYTVDPPTPPPLPTHFVVNATSVPSDGGGTTVTLPVDPGLGFAAGEIATVTATASSGYTFGAWFENDALVSTNPMISFPVTRNRNLRAHFNIVGTTPNLRTVTTVITMAPNGEEFTVKIGALPAVKTPNSQNKAPYTVVIPNVIGGTTEHPNIYPILITRKNGAVFYSNYVMVHVIDITVFPTGEPTP